MYRNVRNRVRVSDDFLVQLGLHQGSILSPLLFVIVLEVLSREISSECPEELLYADEFTLFSKALEYLKERLEVWKGQCSQNG